MQNQCMFGQRWISVRQLRYEFRNPGFTRLRGPVTIMNPRSDESYWHEPLAQHRLGQQQSLSSWIKPGRKPRNLKKDLLEGRYHRQLEKSHAECPWRHWTLIRFTDKEPQSLLEVESYGHRRFGRPAARHYYSSERKRPRERQINPSRTGEKTHVTETQEIASSGRRNGRAQEAQNVRSSTMTKVEEREKETSDSGHQVRQKDSPLRNQNSATGQAQTRHLVLVTRKRVV